MTRGNTRLGLSTEAIAKLLAFAAACVLALAPGAWAQGTIYYVQIPVKTMWSMNSDGSNRTKLGAQSYGPVSTALHNNHHWFLDTRVVTYPDGTQNSEVFALRDDYDYPLNNTSETRAQLTSDPTLEIYGDGLYSLDWVPGDQKISFKARRRVGGVVVEGGLYTAELAFGPDGGITGLAAQPTAPAIPFALDANQWPTFRTYCWDPTGTKVAYDDGGAGLWVADLLGNRTLIVNSGVHTPRWSPDGTLIAFNNSSAGISVVKPNGRALKEIIRRTPQWTFDRPFWSPSGTQIICYGYATGPYNLDIFRANANGNSLTNLTNTPATPEFPMGWR